MFVEREKILDDVYKCLMLSLLRTLLSNTHNIIDINIRIKKADW